MRHFQYKFSTAYTRLCGAGSSLLLKSTFSKPLHYFLQGKKQPPSKTEDMWPMPATSWNLVIFFFKC